MSASAGAKVPAWKRLGLQLKAGGAASELAPAAASTHNAAPSPAPATPQSQLLGKRKFPADSTPRSGSALKFPRRDANHDTPRPARNVSFSGDTKDTPARTPLAKTPKRATDKAAKPKVKKPAKKAAPVTPNLDKAVEYLRQWRYSRASWKFNKNHTTMMIKYVYEDGGVLPTTDVDTFYDYIRGMQGFSRVRLRQDASEVRDKDEAAKATGFAEGAKNAEGKQEKYDAMIADLKAQVAKGTYSEAEFLSQKVDKFIVRRVVKRMRAERILHELEQSEGEAVTNAPAKTEEKEEAPEKEDGRKTARPRKSRTAPVEEDSSDSSSSEDHSDDDTSSEGESDDEDEDSKSGDDSDSDSSSSSDS